MALLSLQEVSVRFGGPWLLDGATLNVERGERVCLLGRNGEGKSTLLKVAAGQLAPDAGEVVRARNLVTAMMPQVVPDDLSGTVLQTVRAGTRPELDAWHRDTQAQKVVSLMELDPAADCAALSGGMKRRVLVAQALVHRPQVIILDEPTAGVDVELRQSLWAFISRLHREGHTIILTTHYLEEAEQLCERIAILKKGQIAALDRTSTLLQQLAGVRLHLKLRHAISGNVLPPTLWALSAQSNSDEPLHKRLSFTLNNVEQVEHVLASVRMAGGELEDVSVSQADLEDVFVRLVQNPVQSASSKQGGQ